MEYDTHMIRHLTGTVFEIFDESIVVSAQGVGYEVFIPTHTVITYTVGMPISLWTHHAIREQSSDLYGFQQKADLDFFELLLTVSGIGPKSALSIMSKAPIGVLSSGIANQDVNHLVKVGGLGKKVAEKLILALKEKVVALPTSEQSAKGQSVVDAIDALIALGFSEKQARDSVQAMDQTQSTEAMIKKALQTLR